MVAVAVLAQFASAAMPASAESTASLRQKAAAAKARRAQLAAQLNAAQASDQQLDAAVRALDTGVKAQIAATEAAQQALSAAEVTFKQAQARLDATNAQIGQLHTQAQDSAIQAYMHAGGQTVVDLINAKSLNELSRRETLVSQIIASDAAILDKLRAAHEDQAAEQARLSKARDLTRARRKAAGDKLKTLAGELAAQARLRGMLDSRIADYTAEAQAVADQEGSLQGLIKKAEGADATGPASAAGLIWPCRGPLTSGFGMRWGRLHQGQDIACGYGTAIHAAKAGTVIFAGVMSGYGNVVIIDHGGGFSTLYAHQSRIAVSQGQHVDQGEVIGYVGSTGHSTGPHLHFETRFGGTARNPLPYLPK